MRISRLSAILAIALSACGADSAGTVKAPSRAAEAARVAASSGARARLQIRVLKVRARTGKIVAAVYDDADAFPHAERAVASVTAPAMGSPTVLEVPALPPGTYAVVVYHDVDGDGSLDTSFIGYPTEPFGFSNDAPLKMFGPPDFATCSFEVKAPGVAIQLSLTNHDD